MLIEAEVEAGAQGYVLSLLIRTATGSSREQLVAADCALFARLIAIKVALLTAPASTPSEAPPPSAAQGSRTPAPPRTSTGAAVQSAWSVRVQALLATTPLPAPAFGLALGAGHRHAALRLEALAGYLLEREQFYAAQPSVEARCRAGLLACALAPSRTGRRSSWLAARVPRAASCAAGASA